MLSLSSVFRAAGRHPHFLRPSAARALSSAPAAPVNFASIPDIDAIIDVVTQTADSVEAAQALAAETFGVDADASALKGFHPYRFVSPYHYDRKHRMMDLRPKKPALLGPSAADSRRRDIFYQLDIDPVNECQNSVLLSHFVTDMGRIKKRAETGLTWRNQRRVGKAIRRAKMMGIIPVLSKRSLGLIPEHRK